MRNPIFAAETLFLDQSSDGTIRHLTADKTKDLSCGGRIVRLETNQPLVEIGMASGLCLLMSPETAFSLAKSSDGKLIRYTPVQPAPSPIDWQADLDDIEERRFALAGMVCASGVHIFNRYRTSYLIAPEFDLAANVEQFLTRMGAKMELEKVIHKNSNQVTVKPVEAGIFIRSRILTTLVGNLLQEHTQAIAFLPSSVSRRYVFAFLNGLLSTSPHVKGELIFRHRASATIRTLAEHLTFDFGVPCDMHIHPMEPSVQVDVSRPEGHRFTLRSEQLDYAAAAGLLERPKKDLSFYSYDSIETITPLARKVPSVLVTPGERSSYPLTANSFVFQPQFSMPNGIAEIAAHPAVLDDSSDPSKF